MTHKSRFILLFFLIVFFPGQTLPGQDDLLSMSSRRLLDGVSDIDFDGSPDILNIYGPHVLPLFRNHQGRDIAALIMEGGQKTVVFSHDAWFKTSSWTHPGTDRFISNLIEWFIHEAVNKAAPDSEVKILAFRTRNFPERLQEAAVRISRVRNRSIKVESPRNFPPDLSAYSGVATYLPTESDDGFPANLAMEQLKKVLEAGVPLISAGIGWVYESYGDGKRGGDLEKEFLGNRLLSPYGLVFTGKSTSSKSTAVSLTSKEPHLRHLLITESDAFLNSGSLMDPSKAGELWTLGYGVLDWNLALGKDRLDSLVKTFTSDPVKWVPTISQPVPREDGRKRMAIAFLELISRRHPEKFTWLFPALGEFPGRMGGSPSTGVQVVSVKKEVPRWQVLSLWVNSGETIKIRLSGWIPGRGGWLQVGAHTDELFSAQLKTWERWPVIHESWLVRDQWREITVRYSGPLYWKWKNQVEPGKDVSPDFLPRVEIQGARKMPVWSQEVDPTEFKAEIASSDCPFVEILGRNIIFTQPRTSVPPDFNPIPMMNFWDKVAEAVPNLIGVSSTEWPQRFVADRQIRFGYMHSGYPIMTHLDVATYQMGGSEAGYGNGLKPGEKSVIETGAWGHFHELGHNYNDDLWTFNRGGEVTVNLFTLYTLEKLTGRKPMTNEKLLKNKAAVMEYLAKPQWDKWADNPFVALTMYAVLAQELGWEGYRLSFRAYGTLLEVEKPKTEQEKIDTWVRLYSKASGRNIIPWLKRWACPVSEKVQEELRDLTPWRGPENL